MKRVLIIFALAAWVCRDHGRNVLAIIFGIYAFILFLNLLGKTYTYLTRKL